MPSLEEFRKKLGKGEQQPEPPKPPVSTPVKQPYKKDYVKGLPRGNFDKQEYTDLLTAVQQYLATYNNPKRVIKPDGIIDLRNKRLLKLKDKLKKILNY